jgi:CheY-like chemotaxis protein
LLIDDDEEFGTLTARRLARLGVDVDFHKGAFGATQAVLKGDYRVVLLDVNMPALSGPSLLEVLRRQGTLRLLRVVFYSSADNLAELAKTHGADGWLSKGATQNELLGAISAALASAPRSS